MMMALFDKETLVDLYGEEKKQEGRAEGRMEGRREGRAEGRMEGRREGRAEGRMEGENVFAGLIARLSSEKRYEDIDKASNDAAYRQKLFAEYGLA